MGYRVAQIDASFPALNSIQEANQLIRHELSILHLLFQSYTDMDIILEAMRREFDFWHWIEQYRWSTHLAFWLLVLLIAPITSENLTEVSQALIYRGVGMPIKIIATYFLVYYTYPKLFSQKKYIQFLVVLLLSSYLFTVLYRLGNIYIAEVWAGHSEGQESLLEVMSDLEYTVLGYIFRVYTFTAVFIIAKTFKDKVLAERKVASLQIAKTKAELSFLKAQIHPHFLFNTLNNLYYLTIEKSDEAPEVVAKLSEMLDYMLYRCNEAKVPIWQEINLLENYIALEKIRYGDRLDISTDFDLENQQSEIAPLILISLVENAFKHGVSGHTSISNISIFMREQDGVLQFKISNSMPVVPQPDLTGHKKGIGIGNVKRQLELTYPGQYEWNVQQQNKTYQVSLKIKL